MIPSINSVLQETSLRTKTGEAVQDQFDDWKTMNMVSFNELTTRLVDSGDRITANRLLRDRLGITCTEAEARVKSIDKGLEVEADD